MIVSFTLPKMANKLVTTGSYICQKKVYMEKCKTELLNFCQDLYPI